MLARSSSIMIVPITPRMRYVNIVSHPFCMHDQLQLNLHRENYEEVVTIIGAVAVPAG